MSDAPVQDAEVVEGQGVELEPVATESVNLFRTDDPADVLKRAQDTADALMPVVKAKGLISNIKGRDHLRVEAWMTLGSMLGVTPVCVWTKKLENGWEARVEARTLDGRVIGAAESECLRDESTWKSRDDFAIRSMAQTRATSKALASVLRFVATLAGVEGTPAEEMPSEGFTGPQHDGARSHLRASDKQLNFLGSLVKKAGGDSSDEAVVIAYATERLTGGKGGTVSKWIDGLNGSKAGEACVELVRRAREWDTATQPSDTPADTEGLAA